MHRSACTASFRRARNTRQSPQESSSVFVKTATRPRRPSLCKRNQRRNQSSSAILPGLRAGRRQCPLRLCSAQADSRNLPASLLRQERILTPNSAISLIRKPTTVRRWRSTVRFCGRPSTRLPLRSEGDAASGLQSSRGFVLPDEQDQVNEKSDLELITWLVVKKP